MKFCPKIADLSIDSSHNNAWTFREEMGRALIWSYLLALAIDDDGYLRGHVSSLPNRIEPHSTMTGKSTRSPCQSLGFYPSNV